jgi:ATP-dependent exoDNAse (exonuclease V) beta subunit
MQSSSRLKVYKASAGSGKTYALAKEFIAETLAMGSPYGFRHILAVTFTKDATGEMKDRILAELCGLAFNSSDSDGFLADVRNAMRRAGKTMDAADLREKARLTLDAILHDYSRLNITTIDSFFQKVLRNLARELGVGSKFNIEMNSSRVRLEAVSKIIETAHLDPQLLQWLTTFVEDRLEQGGNWRFSRDVYNFSACIYNEMFQKNEKRLRDYLEQHPSAFGDLLTEHNRLQAIRRNRFKEILAEVVLTFNNYGLSVDNFSSGKTILKYWQDMADNQNGKFGKTIEKCIDSAEAWTKKDKKSRPNEALAAAETRLMPLLRETVELKKNFDASRLIRQNIHQLGLVWYIAKAIDEANRENNRFMLSDTSLFLNNMIADSDSPFIYEKTGAEIHHILIDEFQDTSHLQWSNFRTLMLDIIAQNHFSLLVGDVKQAIYRWRNGDWSILNNIAADLPVEQENLPYNFRSEEQTVNFNNRFFSLAGKAFDQKYTDELQSLPQPSPFATAYSETSVVQQPVHTGGKGFVRVEFIEKTKNEDEEPAPDFIVQCLKTLKDAGVAANEICILTRTNSEIADIATNLAALKPFNTELAAEGYLNIISDDAFSLSSSEAVCTIIRVLRGIDNPALVYLAPSSDMAAAANQGLMPLPELLSSIYRQYGLNRLQGQSAYMFALFDAANEFIKSNSTGELHAFLEWWDEELHNRKIPTGNGLNGVRAMTVHKSKGLQFHTVVMPYCSWSINPKPNSTIVWCEAKKGVYDLPLLPVTFSETMDNTVFSPDYANEKALSWLDNLNLLYVAFTRAERNLLIYCTQKKKETSVENIADISDIIRLIVPKIDAAAVEGQTRFCFGALENSEPKKENCKETSTEIRPNALKEIPLPSQVEFCSYDFGDGKPVFRQSNKSRDFVDPNSAQNNRYIEHGRIMHALFEQIVTPKDIPISVDRMISEGLIPLAERQHFIETVGEAIEKAGITDWFSDKYRVYSEFSVLLEENDEITTRRPDRVMISDNETIVVDYKFGEPHEQHEQQVKQYIDLLRDMGYRNVSGRLWYVDKKIVTIE